MSVQRDRPESPSGTALFKKRVFNFIKILIAKFIKYIAKRPSQDYLVFANNYILKKEEVQPSQD